MTQDRSEIVEAKEQAKKDVAWAASRLRRRIKRAVLALTSKGVKE